MTIPSQVRHVFAKDLRETKWSLLIYIAVVVAVTLRVIHKSLSDSSQLFVVMPGIVFVALVTMSDSPTQPDAFWASRPLHPLAVLGAKLLMAFAIVVGLPLVGQWIGLVRYDVGGQHLAVLMSKTAWTYASWLLIGMMGAAFTRDMRSFLVSVIWLPFLFLMVGQLMSEPISVGLSARLEQVLTVAGVFGSALLLVHVYRTRDTRLRVRAAAVAVSVLLVVSLIFPSPSELSPAVAAPPSMPRAKLRLELNQNHLVERNRIEVTVVADSLAKNERTVISAHVLLMTLADGTTLRLPIANGSGTFNPLAVPEQPGITWLGTFTEQVHRGAFVAQVSSEQRLALSRGIRSAAIDANIETFRAGVAAIIPLAAGARFVSNGRIVRVVGYSRVLGELLVDLISETIARPQHGLVIGPSPDFALVNRERGQATPLLFRRGDSRRGVLALPGISVRFDSMSFYLPSSARDQPRPLGSVEHADSLDENWLRGAGLMILDWESLGTYPARVEWPEKPRG